MMRIRNFVMNQLRILQYKPSPVSVAKPPHNEQKQPCEEERTPYYDPQRFYPARIGEILNDQYQICTKLGYGTHSTVWLAKNLLRLVLSRRHSSLIWHANRWRWLSEDYVAIKITALDPQGKSTAENELKISKAIAARNSHHEGWHFVRTLRDSFIASGPTGHHICLVFEPLREPLWLLKKRFEGNVIPSGILKIMVKMLLHGLDYLHQECHIVHTGKRDFPSTQT